MRGGPGPVRDDPVYPGYEQRTPDTTRGLKARQWSSFCAESSSDAPRGPYSSSCLEDEFCELRLYGVLRSSGDLEMGSGLFHVCVVSGRGYDHEGDKKVHTTKGKRGGVQQA